MSAKLEEAKEHRKAAEKYLKTTLFRWNPDYDSAADEYSQAAQCYRIARDVKHCVECHMKASQLFARTNAFFHAAKSLETALLVCKDEAKPEQLYKLAFEAGSLYQMHGSGDSAASILEKGAKIIENARPDMAVVLYQHAADVSSSESSQHQGAEFMGKASRLYVKLERYDEAVDSLRREISFHQEANNTDVVGRLVVAVVLVHLARGDIVAAEKSYREWGNNCEASEMETIELLLQAYDEEDREMAKRALHSPFLRGMDVEYCRLATKIPLPKEIAPAPKAWVRENAAPAYVSTGSQSEEFAGQSANTGTSFEESPDGTVVFKKEDHHQAPKAEEEEDLC